MKKFVLSIATLVLLPANRPNDQIPIIESESETIHILDDGDETAKTLVWGIHPDTYVYHPASGPKTVSYLTGVARLDLTVSPGETKDIAIRHRGRIYRHRITATDPDIRHSGPTSIAGVETIPFRVGPDNAIHLTGRLNGSGPLDLLFDTGASVAVLSEQGTRKGASIRPGKTNHLRLGTFSVGGLPAIASDYGASLQADGSIPHAAFAGMVVEIDYERSILRIHRTPPPRRPGYRKVPMKWRGKLMLVPITMQLRTSSRDVLAQFDTASRWSLVLANHDPLASERRRGLEVLGRRSISRPDGSQVRTTVLKLPSLGVAGLRLSNVQIDLEETSKKSGLSFHVIGNDLLKRFNVILDYRNGEIHLKPNRLAGTPYSRVTDIRQLITQAFLLLVAVGVAITLVRRARARRRDALSRSAG